MKRHSDVPTPYEPMLAASPRARGGSPADAPGAGFDLAALMEANRRSRHRAIAAAVALVMVLAAVGAGAALWLNSPKSVGPGVYYDVDAQSGQAPWKSQEELQAELDRVVEEGMFDIAIAATIEFPAPGEEGLALIENVPANRYDMRVSLLLDGTEEEVYRSGLIAPGSYIQSVRLTRDLEPGSHQAKAVFEAVDSQTHEAVGKAAAEVELVVKGG